MKRKREREIDTVSGGERTSGRERIFSEGENGRQVAIEGCSLLCPNA
jgi:hypothetical protein